METPIEQLIQCFIEDAKKNRKVLLRLKNLAIANQQFELGAKIREMETEYFPETVEVKQAKTYAKELNTALRMVNLNVSDEACWLISETVKQLSKKGGEFSLSDACSLRTKMEEIFLTE